MRGKEEGERDGGKEEGCGRGGREGRERKGELGGLAEHLAYSARCPDLPTAAPTDLRSSPQEAKFPADSTFMTLSKTEGKKKNLRSLGGRVSHSFPASLLEDHRVLGCNASQSRRHPTPLRLWTFSRFFFYIAFLGKLFFSSPAWPKDKPVSIHRESRGQPGICLQAWRAPDLPVLFHE